MRDDKEENKRFTISLPHKLYDDFELFRKKLNISRSDSIRKAMHSYMISEENIPELSGNVVGCITMIMVHEHIKSSSEHLNDHTIKHNQNHKHDHEYSSKPIYANVQQTDSLIAKDIQHHFGDIIISTLHVHLQYEKCMEIIAISGSYDRVKKLRDDLQRLKSVLSIGFFVVDKGENQKNEKLC